jgi:DNA-binding transcriptional MerR regulator
METFTIGRLADDAGVNIETVRYYERRGLLREPPRSEAGYRQYSASDLWRLQFIARAKRLGFTLSEIATLVGDDGDDGEDPSESILRLARAKVDALDERRRSLEKTRARLTRLIDLCGDPTSPDCRALQVAG